MPRAEVLAHRIAHHGEGAVWWPDGHLRMVDGYAGELVDLMPDGTARRTQVGGYAACVRPRTGGGAVAGVDRGFVLIEPDGTLRPVPDVIGAESRMNEGNCDPDGNFWCGSMGWEKQDGAGTLYRMDVEGNVSIQVQDATIPNGLGWSPDGTRVFWNDTPTQTVWTFDYAWDVGLVDRRPFVRIDPDDGAPDGLTVDRFGAVWVAMWGAHAVRRYDADGRLDTVVDIGAAQVSSCALGGPEFDRLYVTTSREDLPDDADPLAGSVFVWDVGESAGLPPLPFGG